MLILKVQKEEDRLLTQSPPDICRKLQKQAFAPNQSLEKLLQLAQTVYYGREYEEEKSRQKRSRQKTEAPTMAVRPAVRNSLRKMPRGTQVKRDRLVITVERRGISSRIALRHLSHPRLHVQSVKDHNGEETALRDVGPRGQTLKTIVTECLGVPT